MRRVAVVTCLIFSLLLTGCAGRRWQLGDAVANATDGVNRDASRWLDDHPVMKGCAYCAMITGIVVIVAGAIVAVAYSHTHEANNPWPPFE